MKLSRNEQRPLSEDSSATILAAETLRSAASPEPPATPAKGEERISVFWRVFGGTVLSIVALVAVTLYQQLSGGINELRTNLASLNADLRKDISSLGKAQGELIKKDEFNSRMTSVWAGIKDLQTVCGTVTGLKERALVQDQQERAAAETRDHLCKEVQALGAAVAALKERSSLREQQQKDEEERKELVRELQTLRERLASLEGRQGVVPAKAEAPAPGGKPAP